MDHSREETGNASFRWVTWAGKPRGFGLMIISPRFDSIPGATIMAATARFRALFSSNLPAVIGMIHVKPLPGTPLYQGQSVSDIVAHAREEAKVYVQCGVDSILIENMHDIPYMNRAVGPEIVAAMTSVCQGVRDVCPALPFGIQILAGCNKEAMACAKAAELQYIRAEGYVFAHVADEGHMNSDAGELLRYRKSIAADNVLVFTDLKKKHSSHAITSDVTIEECVHAARFFQSDAAIITGRSTGDAANADELDILMRATDAERLPVIIGSGVSVDNVASYMKADAFIVGSHFKRDGYWMNTLSAERIERFMERVKALR